MYSSIVKMRYAIGNMNVLPSCRLVVLFLFPSLLVANLRSELFPNYLILRSQKLRSEIDSPEMLRFTQNRNI